MIQHHEPIINTTGQSLLEQSLKHHEAGHFEKSLQLFDATYEKFKVENNPTKMAEALCLKTLTFLRLDKLLEAKEALQLTINLTKETPGVVLPLYNLAKVEDQMGEQNCINTYKSAITAAKKHKPRPHYRPAFLNDMQIHLGIAQLRFDTNPQDAESNIVKAVQALLANEALAAFEKMVWSSGGYLGLARYYNKIDSKKAWIYFDLAEKLIIGYPKQSNHELLRIADLEKLRTQISPRS
jgi:hypothetical protein